MMSITLDYMTGHFHKMKLLEILFTLSVTGFSGTTVYFDDGSG